MDRWSLKEISRSALAVLGGVLLLTAALGAGSAVSAELTAGPEFPVGGLAGPTPYLQEESAVAAGGTGYLVVWRDNRNKVNYPADPDDSFDIYGIMVDVNGNPMMPEAFLISTVSAGVKALHNQVSPAVAWNGTNFLVVWSDRRTVDQIPHIYGARVTTSGAVLDPAGILISFVPAQPPPPAPPVPVYDQNVPAVASNGIDWQVVWQENTGVNYNIYGARITAAGSVTARGGIATASGNKANPDIAWNNGNYLVVWEDARNSETSSTDIYGCRVNSAGAKVGSTDILISNRADAPTTGESSQQEAPSVAANSSGTATVVWVDYRNNLPLPAPKNTEIFAARVNSSGTVLDPGGKPIFADATEQDLPDIGWDGSQFVIAWRAKAFNPQPYRPINGCRFTSAGVVLDLQPFLVSNTSTGGQSISVADDLITWNNSEISNTDVYGTKINNFGGIVAQNLISKSVQDQRGYQAVWNGNGYGVVWADRRNGSSYQIYGTRVDTDGVVMDPNGVDIGMGTGQSEPAIAWNGSGYLVVWRQNSNSLTLDDIFGMRLNANFQPIDASPFPVAVFDENQKQPAVAWNGSKYIAVWSDFRGMFGGVNNFDLHGAQINPSGPNPVSSLPTVVVAQQNDQLNPALVANGSDIIAVWEDYRSGIPNVYALKIASNGAVSPVGGIQVSAGTSSKSQPKITFDGTNNMVVWTDNRNSVPQNSFLYGNDLYGAKLSSTPSVVTADIPLVANIAADQMSPGITWTGQNHLLVWQDFRVSANSGDIYMLKLNSAGTPIDPNPSILANSILPEGSPSVAGGLNAQAAFYSKFANALSRVMARTLNDPAAIPVATIHEAKALSDGTKLSLGGQVAIAGTDQLGNNTFYIEERGSGYLSGIRIVTSGEAVAEGNVVDLVGTIQTVGSERQISTSSVSVTNQNGTIPEAFAMPNFGVGGTGLLVNTNIGSAYLGANNIGLLVRVYGTVTYVGGGGEPFFYVDDGRAVSDGSGHVGVKIISGSLAKPTIGQYKIITGVASSESSGGTIVRRVLARKQSDIADP